MSEQRKYICQGGPFDGAHLTLSTGATARLLVGPWRGRYVLQGTKPYVGDDVAGDEAVGSTGATLMWRAE